MINEYVKSITAEIAAALADISETEAQQATDAIRQARRVVVHGAGRVGLAGKAFAMRLGHLGFSAHTVTDSTIPPLGPGDLLIVASSTGETSTVVDVATLARSHNARVLVFSASPASRLARLADQFILLKTPTKFGSANGVASIQPMATLFEQALQIFFDLLVLLLMKQTVQQPGDLWARHTNLD
jgi:6-phospho-3-hexuloisomerase